MRPGIRNIGQRQWHLCRRGASSLEMIMAFTLLGSVLAFSTPLIVRHQRLVASQREYRLALDEASNQIDRLSVLSRAELRQAISQLQPSDFVATRLAGVKVRGESNAVDSGDRVKISISWGDEQRASAPITLTAWLAPQAAGLAPAAERRESR